jgi:hypothetical protein
MAFWGGVMVFITKRKVNEIVESTEESDDDISNHTTELHTTTLSIYYTSENKDAPDAYFEKLLTVLNKLDTQTTDQ